MVACKGDLALFLGLGKGETARPLRIISLRGSERSIPSNGKQDNKITR